MASVSSMVRCRSGSLPVQWSWMPSALAGAEQEQAAARRRGRRGDARAPARLGARFRAPPSAARCPPQPQPPAAPPASQVKVEQRSSFLALPGHATPSLQLAACILLSSLQASPHLLRYVRDRLFEAGPLLFRKPPWSVRSCRLPGLAVRQDPIEIATKWARINVDGKRVATPFLSITSCGNNMSPIYLPH